MNYGQRFMTLYRRQGSRPSPWKINAKKANWMSEEALQIDMKRREVKSKEEKKRCERQRRKGLIYPFECTVPKKSKER